jgi:hypothetical protein
VSFKLGEGQISDPRIIERRDINRNWYWVAVDDTGIQYREQEYRSISNLPKGLRIVRMTAAVVGVDPFQSPEFGIMLPEGAEPLAFSVHQRTEFGQGDVLTVIGYIAQDGTRQLLHITERGDALLTDRRLEDYP